MLNKNQSNKRNIWKYSLVLPVIIAFVFLFQIKVVAQTKESKTKEVPEYKYAVSSKYSSILTKNTTDQEIKAFEKIFSDEKQKLTISNVKRNSNDEIIAIKLEFDFGKTYNRVMERKSDKGINNIKIYINSDEDDDLAYGFEDIDSKTEEAILIEENEPKENFWTMDNMEKNGKDVILIINGKIQGQTEKIKLPFDEEVGKMIEITPSEFEKKYHKNADSDKLFYEVKTIKKTDIKNISTEKEIGFVREVTKEEYESLNTNSQTKQDDINFSGIAVRFDSNDPDVLLLSNSMFTEFKKIGIDVNIENIKRNKDNKIISISVLMNSKEGKRKKHEYNNTTTPIKSISVFANKNQAEEWEFGVIEGKEEIISTN